MLYHWANAEYIYSFLINPSVNPATAGLYHWANPEYIYSFLINPSANPATAGLYHWANPEYILLFFTLSSFPNLHPDLVGITADPDSIGMS